ncbi:MAG: hypothetical protein NTY03_08690 [Candidatus Bathyarchaeota archaeon]|nr:hypothetical protein [Candidatus Bathyarchaeota archaeon]
MTSILLAAITFTSLFYQIQPTSPRRVSLNDLKVEITTTKGTYVVGEIINGTVWFVNDSPRLVYLDPIYTVYMNMGYSDTISGSSSRVFIDYTSPNAVIEIPAWGRVAFLPFHHEASRVGTFMIRIFGVSYSVRIVNPKF